MKTSTTGRALIQSFESCKLKAYPDPKTGGDPWTIGWGHTGPNVHEGLIWTQQQADDAFKADLLRPEETLAAYVKVPLLQGQFDALVSILFNVGAGSALRDGIIRLKTGGPSTLLRKLNAGDYAGCAAEFGKWISKGTAAESGLTRRRNAEAALFRGEDWRKFS